MCAGKPAWVIGTVKHESTCEIRLWLHVANVCLDYKAMIMKHLWRENKTSLDVSLEDIIKNQILNNLSLFSNIGMNAWPHIASASGILMVHVVLKYTDIENKC